MLARVRSFSLIFILYSLLGGWAFAQRLADSDIPAIPPSGFLDDEGVLGNNPSLQRRVIELLQELDKKHGYRLIVVVGQSLIGTNAKDYAAQLQKEWLPKGGGLVLVFESDTGSLGFGRGLESSEGMIDGEMVIPSFSLIDIVSKSLKAARTTEAKEVYLENLITELCSRLDGYFELRASPLEGGRSLRLALATIGALSLLALCGMGLGWLMGKADSKQAQTRLFPEVETPERLGAPYGGGGGACRSFGPRSNH
jgi:hypothetical protein